MTVHQNLEENSKTKSLNGSSIFTLIYQQELLLKRKFGNNVPNSCIYYIPGHLGYKILLLNKKCLYKTTCGALDVLPIIVTHDPAELRILSLLLQISSTEVCKEKYMCIFIKFNIQTENIFMKLYKQLRTTIPLKWSIKHSLSFLRDLGFRHKFLKDKKDASCLIPPNTVYI